MQHNAQLSCSGREGSQSRPQDARPCVGQCLGTRPLMRRISFLDLMFFLDPFRASFVHSFQSTLQINFEGLVFRTFEILWSTFNIIVIRFDDQVFNQSKFASFPFLFRDCFLGFLVVHPCFTNQGFKLCFLICVEAKFTILSWEQSLLCRIKSCYKLFMNFFHVAIWILT